MKRFLVTLGLSVGIWVVSVIIQGYLTFAKYIGTFSTGCPATGYQIDSCTIPGPYTPPVVAILINIVFWFWIVRLFWGWVDKGQAKP